MYSLCLEHCTLFCQRRTLYSRIVRATCKFDSFCGNFKNADTWHFCTEKVECHTSEKVVNEHCSFMWINTISGECILQWRVFYQYWIATLSLLCWLSLNSSCSCFAAARCAKFGIHMRTGGGGGEFFHHNSLQLGSALCHGGQWSWGGEFILAAATAGVIPAAERLFYLAHAFIQSLQCPLSAGEIHYNYQCVSNSS